MAEHFAKVNEQVIWGELLDNTTPQIPRLSI